MVAPSRQGDIDLPTHFLPRGSRPLPARSFILSGLRAMSCLFPGLATTLQKKTHLGFEWTTEGGVKGVGFLQWSSKFLGFSTVPCCLLYGLTGMPSWRYFTPMDHGTYRLHSAWSSTRTQARSRQVTAATCATHRPQPTNPNTRDSPHTAPPHSLTRPQARHTDERGLTWRCCGRG